jgi:hypothetical protein
MRQKRIAKAFYLQIRVKQEANLEVLTPDTIKIFSLRDTKQGLSNEGLNSLNKTVI